MCCHGSGSCARGSESDRAACVPPSAGPASPPPARVSACPWFRSTGVCVALPASVASLGDAIGASTAPGHSPAAATVRWLSPDSPAAATVRWLSPRSPAAATGSHAHGWAATHPTAWRLADDSAFSGRGAGAAIGASQTRYIYHTPALSRGVQATAPHPAPIQAQLAATLSLSMQFLVLDYQTMEM